MADESPKRLIVVGDRVLIAPEQGEERTNVGLYLPATALESRQVQGGRIIATGPGNPVSEPASMDEEPWKIHAARLIQALDELKTDTERSNFKVYMAKFVSQAQSPLNDILGGKNTPNPTELGTWLDNNKPTSTSLFKDRPDIVIKETEKAEQ